MECAALNGRMRVEESSSSLPQVVSLEKLRTLQEVCLGVRLCTGIRTRNFPNEKCSRSLNFWWIYIRIIGYEDVKRSQLGQDGTDFGVVCWRLWETTWPVEKRSAASKLYSESNAPDIYLCHSSARKVRAFGPAGDASLLTALSCAWSSSVLIIESWDIKLK
jgi:hypothetical protein